MSNELDSLVRSAAAQAGGAAALFAESDCGGLPAGQTVPSARVALAVVVWPVAIETVGALRDQWAERVVLFAEKSVAPETFVSLGFSPVELSSSHYQRFEFDINHYKQTPDWFNAKGWANPQNWNKYRW